MVQRASAQQPKGVAHVGGTDVGEEQSGPSAAPATGSGLLRMFALGAGQLAKERGWSATIGRRPPTPRVVGFVAGKGGVGTTSCAAATALTIASLWPGQVALADTRNGTASLGERLGGVAAAHAATFAAGRAEPLRVSGVTIVDGAPWDTPLTRPTLARLVTDLREDHLFTVLDVGDDAGDTGHGALTRLDQVVVVTTPAADALDAALRTLRRLESIDSSRAGFAVVAVIGLRGLRGRRKPDQADLHQAARIVHLPWDPSLNEGAAMNAERWRRNTRAAFLELAAAITAD